MKDVDKIRTKKMVSFYFVTLLPKQLTSTTKPCTKLYTPNAIVNV